MLSFLYGQRISLVLSGLTITSSPEPIYQLVSISKEKPLQKIIQSVQRLKRSRRFS